MSKRLEVVWPHKGEHVLCNSETGKWEFCGNEPLPPRPLIEIEAFGDEKDKKYDPENSNLLIKGENLFALQSLLPYYAGKVKLIYIDPPFNTGQDFEAYDDNFEHSVWLGMMKERLELAEILLHDNGCIAVEIDSTEQSYLKLLLDGIFTRKNFITTISIKRSAGTGHKAINPGMINVTEFIHLYAKNKKNWKYNKLFIPRNKYDKAYNKWIENPDDPIEQWRFITLREAFVKSMGYENLHSAKEALKDNFKKELEKFAIDNADNVIRFAEPDYDKVSNEAREYIDRSLETDIVLCLQREEYDDMYFIKGQRILFLAKKVTQNEEEYSIVEPLTNFWDDISWQGIANEGSVVLKKGKKPEKLLQRLINLSTDEDDIVLDFFAGSGTTGAVAQKLKRKWIMIELGEQAENKALVRMKNVLNGDTTGISTKVNWQGGGGFRFLEVGDPFMIEDPETKLTIINPKYTNGPLIRAVCAIEGFILTGDTILHGKNGEHFAHITEIFVDDSQIKKLSKRINDNQSITVYAAKGIKRGLKLPKKVKVKRISSDLIKKFTK